HPLETDSVPMTRQEAHDGGQHVVGERRGLQTQFQQRSVTRIVVVLLALDARICDMIDLYRKAQSERDALDAFGQFKHAEAFSELVEDTVLARRRWVKDAQRDAVQCVTDIQVATRLTALAVHSEPMPSDCLDTEAI